jgi:hypothetical protein
MLKRLNSLWDGDRLGYLEQLSLVSAMELGHPMTVYSYTPDELLGVPTGVELRDAREIMPVEKLVRYSDTGAVALGANFFRYALLSKDVGYWVDLDLYFLKPLDFKEEYVFGWEYENWINNAVLHAPANSGVVRDLMEIPGTNKRPPWYGPRNTLKYYWRRLTEGDIRVQDLPWGTYSAGILTYVTKKHRVANQGQPPEVFYPVRWKDAKMVYGPAETIESMITPKTRTVHLWHSRLVGLFDKPPAQGSYIDKVCRRHGIDTGVAE